MGKESRTETTRKVAAALDEFTKEEVVDFLARHFVRSGVDLRELYLAQAERIEHKAGRLMQEAKACKNEDRKARKLARVRAMNARAERIRREAHASN
jgi:hypothetical protein